jgi:hypothetical protein
VTQSAHSSNLWTEPANGGGTPTSTGLYLVLVGGEYVLRSRVTPDAELVDWHQAGSVFEMVITGSPYVIIDNAGVLELSASGTAAAILVDDAGGLVLSTDLTLNAAGAFYPAANGNIVAARFDDTRLRFVQANDVIYTY